MPKYIVFDARFMEDEEAAAILSAFRAKDSKKAILIVKNTAKSYGACVLTEQDPISKKVHIVEYMKG